MKRWDVLIELIKDKNPKVGAEIGVLSGNVTVKVLKRIPTIKTYYAIDPWEWYPTYEDTLSEHGKKIWNKDMLDRNFIKFQKNTKRFGDIIKVLKMFSSKAAKHIKDYSLDFIFIDGNHSYEYVKEDVELYLPKVKKGGLLGGHDYGHIVGGVEKAINELFDPDEFFLGDNKTWWVWV